MLARLRPRLDFRIALAAVFTLLHGVGNVAFDTPNTMAPFIGALVGWVVGMILASWWALLVAPAGFTLGLAVAHAVGIAVVPVVWSDWAVMVVLSLVFVVPGVYVGRWAHGSPRAADAA